MTIYLYTVDHQDPNLLLWLCCERYVVQIQLSFVLVAKRFFVVVSPTKRFTVTGLRGRALFRLVANMFSLVVSPGKRNCFSKSQHALTGYIDQMKRLSGGFDWSRTCFDLLFP